MLKFVFTVVLLSLTLKVSAQSDIELLYSGIKFNLPGYFTVVGDFGGEDNILVFRYGNVRGKNYLAFTNMTQDSSIDYGCEVSLFYNEVFSKGRGTSCNEENVNIMREAFIEDKEVDVWRVNDYVLNYSAGESKSFLFISGEDGKLIKIDSDFLDKESFKNLMK